MKKILIFILMFFSGLVLLNNEKVNADGIPYQTFTYSNASKRFVPTQDAYLPLSQQNSLGKIEINNPTDITIDVNDNIYIADSNRIIKYNLRTDETIEIGLGDLKRVTGVFVDHLGNVYVTDNQLNEAYQYKYDSLTDTYIKTVTYKKPVDTPYFADGQPFVPSKIVVDKSGIVYVLLSGNINGLGKFTNDGKFTGFFGGNQIPATFSNMIKNIVFDENQRRKWFKMIPKPVYNIAVDNDGLILTTTKSEPGYLKLNIANNVFNKSNWGYDNIEDIFVGPYNTIFTVTANGFITEYSPEGSTLFVFGGTDVYNQKGLFKKPTGIAVDSKNNLYVLDSDSKNLQVFIPTDFANLVHEALKYYQDGQYTISLDPWQEVLKRNNLFDIANKGIGDAYFAMGEYDLAMESYYVARDQAGFSEAYWEVRNIKLLNSGPVIIGVLIALIVLYILNLFLPFTKYIKMPFKKLNENLKRFKIYNELLYGFTIIKKPVDGFYGIKREQRSSNLTATIYLLLFFLVYVLFIFKTSFLFNSRVTAEIDMVEQILFIFIPFGLWVIANYLVSSIRDGEGKLSDVYQASAYSLLPMIIALPILTVSSNILSLNEAFLYHAILIVGISLTAFYFIMMVKEIHFYEGRETFSNIVISIFTAVMILAFILIIYFLGNEILGFFKDIIREVTSRG